MLIKSNHKRSLCRYSDCYTGLDACRIEYLYLINYRLCWRCSNGTLKPRQCLEDQAWKAQTDKHSG